MNWTSLNFDWNQAKAFLATAEEGSLSAAARALGLTQPTVGRQITALEGELGVTLFDRVGRSLALTDAGLSLLDHVRSMGDAASLVSLSASGRAQVIAGQVCITATDGMAAYYLPEVIARLRKSAPEIEVEILASNALQDLRRREADIAIRHVRPEQPELIARLVRESTGHLYASTGFLERHGRPDSVAALSRYDFVGFEDPERYVRYFNALGLSLTRDNIRVHSNSGIACWEMVKAGLGIGAMLKETGDATPEVEVLLPEAVSVDVPVWLTTHQELHTSRRIRVVFDLLADAFQSDRP
ncbi:MAG: LysR family transcriptional regulator [Pseudomonadota bacterium]